MGREPLTLSYILKKKKVLAHIVASTHLTFAIWLFYDVRAR
jgi:hypothetical protein